MPTSKPSTASRQTTSRPSKRNENLSQNYCDTTEHHLKRAQKKGLTSQPAMTDKSRIAEKVRSKQRNLLVASAMSTHGASNMKPWHKSPASSKCSRRSRSSLSKSGRQKSSRMQDFQSRLDHLETEQQDLQRSLHLGRSSLYDTKNYGHIAKENAVLQTKLDKKTAQLNALTADYKQAQCDLNLV